MRRRLLYLVPATLVAGGLMLTPARAETPVDRCATSPPATDTTDLSRESMDLFLQCYHARPQPDLVPGLLKALDREFRQQEQRGEKDPPVGLAEAAAGWIAMALRRNPERLDAWSDIPISRPLRFAFVFAINLAGRPEDAVSLAERLFLAPEVIEALTTPRPEALAPAAAGAADFDRLWGAAFASGDPAFVVPIIDALDRLSRESGVTAPDLAAIVTQNRARLGELGKSMEQTKLASAIVAGSALWSLCSNGARQPFIYRAIDARRATLAPVAAQVLNDCLAERLGGNRAGQASSPT